MNIYKYINKFLLNLFCLLFSFHLLAVDEDNKAKLNILGNLSSPNILVEYASLSCIHCANFHNDTLPIIKEKLIDTGKIKYVYKDFPLDLPAMLASMISHCYQGEQYFVVLNSLYRNQKKWITASNSKDELYKKFHLILKQHGISLEKIKLCTEDTTKNKKKWESILATRLEGQKLGVNSTPSFFLNGKRLEGLVDLEMLLKHIY